MLSAPRAVLFFLEKRAVLGVGNNNTVLLTLLLTLGMHAQIGWLVCFHCTKRKTLA